MFRYSVLVSLLVSLFAVWDRSEARDLCSSPFVNRIVEENCKAGSPESEWQAASETNPPLGFTTDFSVNSGQIVRFKLHSNASATAPYNLKLDIFRLGYYGGRGARKVASSVPVGLHHEKGDPMAKCRRDRADYATTGLISCDWTVSAEWSSTGMVSGVYVAKIARIGYQEASSHIPFVIRDDSSRSDLLFQTSDTTWQAYNQFGGNSLYSNSSASSSLECAPNSAPAYDVYDPLANAYADRAFKVSYDRPFLNWKKGCRDDNWLFAAEYAMIRWLATSPHPE